MSATSKRAKRTTRSMYRRMDNLMGQTLELKALFDEHHPELAAVLEQVNVGIMLSQQLLETFYAASWGSVPFDWYIDA